MPKPSAQFKTLRVLLSGNVQAFQETLTLSVDSLEKLDPFAGKRLMKFCSRIARDHSQGEMWSFAIQAEIRLEKLAYT